MAGESPIWDSTTPRTFMPVCAPSLFLIVVADAFEHGVNRILIRLAGADVAVAFEIDGAATARDQFPRRFWHQIPAAAHYLASQLSILHNAERYASDINEIPIREDVADFDNLRQIARKHGLELPRGIRFEFGNDLVVVSFA